MSKKLEISYYKEYVNPYKNMSNNGFTIEKPVRYVFESNKLMSIDKINYYITNYFLTSKYNHFHKMKNKTIEFNFSTINSNGRFGITNWFPLDQTLSKDEWINRISNIDINKTLSLYDGDEKKFEENIKRDKFFLTFRFRPTIGYGSPDSKIGFCFFDALRDANVINVTKRKISNGSGSCVYDYNNSMESVYIDIIDHIHKHNDFNEKLNKRNKSKGKMNKIIYIDDKGGIDFNDMPELEKFFKCNIFINYNNHFKDKYISPNKFNKTIYLNFHNGHYELDKEHKPVFDFYDDKKLYVGNKKLDILIYDKEKYYDGKNYFYKKDLNTEQTSLLYTCKHIVNYKRLKGYYGSDDIKTIHDLYKSDCEELEKYGIKLLHSPSLQKALFQMLKLDIRYLNIKTERVTDCAEYEIIKNGSKGGYNYVYKFDEIFKDVYSYDVKSSYPSILNHPDLKIPYKRGDYGYVAPEIFKKYTELKKNKDGFYKIELQYGFYKCKISKSTKSNNFDDFRINEYNIYTHFDILLAKILGYDVELLNENIYPYVINNTDKPFNRFVYNSDQLIDSNIIFRKLVKRLFDIKQKCKGNRVIKIMSSGIWGNFCDDKTYKTKTVKIDGDTINLNLENNEYFENIKPNHKDSVNYVDCRYKTADNLTRTSLFRMKPFLLSYQRYIMYIECIKKIEDAGGKILKIKIDGVYTDKKIDEFEFDKENNTKQFIDGDIVREKHFDIILFKNRTYYLTNEQDIKEYLISKNTKKPKKPNKKSNL